MAYKDGRRKPHDSTGMSTQLACPMCGWFRPLNYGRSADGLEREVSFDKVDVENGILFHVRRFKGGATRGEGPVESSIEVVETGTLETFPAKYKDQIRRQCLRILAALGEPGAEEPPPAPAPLRVPVVETEPTISIEALPIWSGRAWRYETGYDHPHDTSIADLLRYEMRVLGNRYENVTQGLLNELERYRASDALWVTKRRKDALRYLPEGLSKTERQREISRVIEVHFPPGSRTVVEDEQGGYLVLDASAEPFR